MATHRSVEFFDSQFRRQVAASEFALNPFERLALEHLRGEVVDLGCGLGNLALAAARRGCRVTAVDASPAAIERIREAAARESLPVAAVQADALSFRFERDYDCVVAIGLLMFFRRENAETLLRRIRDAVQPGGLAVVNVLIEGTTWLESFEPGNYTLFGPDELERAFAGWDIVASRRDRFAAPGETLKVFSTVIARRPTAAPVQR